MSTDVTIAPTVLHNNAGRIRTGFAAFFYWRIL